ncbi:MAG: ATP-binding protein [Planctomycetota bacterium]|nr:ATP-binding protein [Planctomycetota bacterium]
MISSEQVNVLFPFSVQVDSKGLIGRLGRTLEKRLPGCVGRPLEDVFDIRRWTDTPREESLREWVDRPILMRVKGDGDPIVLMGALSEVEGGLLFLGGPRLSRVEELEPLELSINDFAVHDGVMTYLFMLQQVRATSLEAANSANELAVSAKSYRQLVEQSNDLIMKMRPDGTVVFANAEACRLLSIMPGTTVFESLLADGNRTPWPHCLDLLANGTKNAWVEFTLHGRTAKTVLVEGPLVRSAISDEPDVLLAFLRDVTDRTEAEDELARSNDQLRRAQKMEAIGRFAGGIAHDFNNLLGVMMGAGGILKEDLPAEDPRSKNVDLILASAEKGSALARRLLMFSKREPSSGLETDVVASTRSLMQILTRVLGREILLEFEANRDSVMIGIDPVQFEQVLMNLVVNARDALPKGGRIKISIRHLAETSQSILEVQDDGIGMAPDVVQKAFEPFFSTKPADKGTGLGLSVVYGIVTDAGGEIDVTSSPGQGTTFSIQLPTLEIATKAGEEPARTSPSKPTLEPNLLAVLIEDQDDLRGLTARGLAGMGFDVRAFQSVEACRTGLSGLGRVPDLFVTDVILGDGNGLDLAEELATKELLKHVVVITGHADLERIDDLLARFGWRLLMKPFTMRQLQLVVGQLLQHA